MKLITLIEEFVFLQKRLVKDFLCLSNKVSRSQEGILRNFFQIYKESDVFYHIFFYMFI
jgi:hypothetical protein